MDFAQMARFLGNENLSEHSSCVLAATPIRSAFYLTQQFTVLFGAPVLAQPVKRGLYYRIRNGQ